MKSTYSNEYKSIRESLRTIAKLTKQFEEMDALMMKTRNIRAYDSAQNNAAESYKLIISEISELLRNADLLGASVSALDVLKYHSIEEKRFFEH
jgi:hypothetical protein